MIIYVYTERVIHCTCIYYYCVYDYTCIAVVRHKRDDGTSAAVGVRVSTTTTAAVSVTAMARGLINYTWSRAFVVSGGRPSSFSSALLARCVLQEGNNRRIYMVEDDV